jgi:alcohol dehydrogenase (cytochrome c)
MITRLGCALAIAVAALGATLTSQVAYDRILRADASEWLVYSGNYNAQRYSALDAINRKNVGKLKLAWLYQMPTLNSVETTPIVADGVMYVTVPMGSIMALDARTGRQLWSYRRDVPVNTLRVCCGMVNRGVAISGSVVIMGTLDAHLVAVDTRTGKLVWDREVIDHRLGYAITSAPLVVKDRVIIGVAGGEFGARGLIDAYDVTTGKRIWRFWTVPGPGEFGHDTWGPGDAWKSGGAPTWMSGSYDPQLNLVYWGTGNPGPDMNGNERPGDNLFSASLVALDADTGKRKWHFQFTPHDERDWDANQVPVLVDQVVAGKPRKLVLVANRNAFLYCLDRETGEFVWGVPFAKQTWAEGLDAKGRPIVKPTGRPEDGIPIHPGVLGGTNWWSPSYSPQTGYFYVAARDEGAVYYRGEMAPYRPGRIFILGTARPIKEDHTGAIRAFKVSTGEKAWEYPLFAPPQSGLLSTAGGLVFGGTLEGNFFALDAASGTALWNFPVGGQIVADPMTYMSHGRQYVSIAGGHAILTFTIGD